MIVNVIVVVASGGRGGEGVALAGASSVLLGGHGFVFLTLFFACCVVGGKSEILQNAVSNYGTKRKGTSIIGQVRSGNCDKKAGLAQPVARSSHNPKVVSSILTSRINIFAAFFV